MTLLINADHAGEKPRVGERGRDGTFAKRGGKQGPGRTHKIHFSSAKENTNM